MGEKSEADCRNKLGKLIRGLWQVQQKDSHVPESHFNIEMMKSDLELIPRRLTEGLDMRYEGMKIIKQYLLGFDLKGEVLKMCLKEDKGKQYNSSL